MEASVPKIFFYIFLEKLKCNKDIWSKLIFFTIMFYSFNKFLKDFYSINIFYHTLKILFFIVLVLFYNYLL